MLRMCWIMDRIDMSWLSMMIRISPMSARCRTVELMMLLSGYARDLHRRNCIVTGRQDTSGSISSGWPLRGILHSADGHSVTLIGFTVTESFSEWITGNFQLRYPMILISSYSGESRFRKGEGLEVLRTRIRRWTGWWRCNNHVTTWLVAMHRIQDNLWNRWKKFDIFLSSYGILAHMYIYNFLTRNDGYFMSMVRQHKTSKYYDNRTQDPRCMYICM